MEYDLLIRGGRVVDGSGFPSYLADVGVKDGAIVEVGHIPAAEEIDRMRGLVRSAMEAGAFGFSTNRNNRHNREDGKPVGSRLANDQELLSRPGYAADIAIFDPHTVKACEPEWAEDYPGATRRLIQRSEGMHTVIVNGRVIYRDGKLTGDLPGQVLKGAAHQRDSGGLA